MHLVRNTLSNVPVCLELVGLADGDTVLGDLGQLDFVRGASITIEQDTERVLQELLGLLLAHVVALVLAEEGAGQVVTVSGRDLVILIGCSVHINISKEGSSSGIQTADNEGVVVGIHFASAIVHDA
jgi:hypothetical protein